jgi:hypothetical protein
MLVRAEADAHPILDTLCVDSMAARVGSFSLACRPAGKLGQSSQWTGASYAVGESNTSEACAVLQQLGPWTALNDYVVGICLCALNPGSDAPHRRCHRTDGSHVQYAGPQPRRLDIGRPDRTDPFRGDCCAAMFTGWMGWSMVYRYRVGGRPRRASLPRHVARPDHALVRGYIIRSTPRSVSNDTENSQTLVPYLPIVS